MTAVKIPSPEPEKLSVRMSSQYGKNVRPYNWPGRQVFVNTDVSPSNWIVPFDSTTADVYGWP